MHTRFSAALSLLVVVALSSLAAADDFKPVAPSELAMKDNPAAPGAHAMVLELARTSNDELGHEEVYYRIKIFTEEGKKYADIEVPFYKSVTGMDITGVKARTIRPDGTIVPFTGKVFQKTIVKGRGMKMFAKTFTLPEVTPGCIIEYRYRLSWDNRWLIDTSWTLQESLYIKKARYKIIPHTRSEFGTLWQTSRLPANRKIKEGRGGVIELELEDMPAFADERFSPPEKELKPRIDFYYREESLPAMGDEFWKNVAKREYNMADDFIGRRAGIAAAVQELAAPADNAEARLRKLYAKVQSLRNTSYEREKTEQEAKRDKTKSNRNAEDVLKRGYGDLVDLTGLFVAFARAAGYESYMVKVSERDQTFFEPRINNARQLDSYVAYVKADGKEYWLDPGTPLCPFGLLAWRKTGVQGMMLNTKDRANFVTTPSPTSRDAVTRRVANLKFADGFFKGEIQLSFSGQDALYRRLNAKREDEQSVREDLENDLKEMLVGGSTVKLKKLEGLHDDRERLTAVFDAEVPNPPSQAGSRYLMPTSIFERGQVSPFRHEKRTHPVYFSYPYQVLDAVGLTLPPEYKIEALPEKKREENQYGFFDISWSTKPATNTIVMRRSFAVHGFYYPLETYDKLRDFYSKVGGGDEENVVLRASEHAAAGN